MERPTYIIAADVSYVLYARYYEQAMSSRIGDQYEESAKYISGCSYINMYYVYIYI